MSLRPRRSLGVHSPSNKKKAPKKPITQKSTQNRLPYYLKPGAAVEISSDDSGFRGSLYPGRILTITSPENDSVKCQVEYTTVFFDEEGKIPLKEDVDIRHLRPPAPMMSDWEKKKVIKVGEEVDAYYNDGWWEGEVTEVLSDGKFSVFFRSSKEQIRFGKDKLRFHREWVNGDWMPSLMEKKEEEIVDDIEEEDEYLPSNVDPETTREIAKEMFSTSGTLVEVSSEEEGFKGVWFVAKVIKSIGEEKFLVEYRDLREDDEITPLKEETDFLHIRPPPPLPSEEDKDFSVGDKVDAFYNDGWWVGVVIESIQDGRVGILFKQSGEKMRFGRQGLRLHKDWVNGNWELPSKKGEIKKAKVVQKVSLRPKKAIDKKYFNVGTLVEVNTDGEGFEDSWFLAKVIEFRGTYKCVVEYDKVKGEDTKQPLREEVEGSQIRPRPPLLDNVMECPFEKFDKVNALYNDGWWVGVIIQVVAKSKYIIQFNKSQEVLMFHHSQLRVDQEWIDGKWMISSKES